MKILSRNDILTFGPHIGQRVGDVIRVNPQYMRWLTNNLHYIRFTRDAMTWLIVVEQLHKEAQRAHKEKTATRTQR